ncbi:ATP-binding protein [Paenibacillus thiaminolyticus]|uniref:ATP-binding protein n=1 Tax=Paenibacillus TaxID=44249 RepID=UPI001F0DB836|nr:ATP-binding protein [Paenibacillus dendritiformis]
MRRSSLATSSKPLPCLLCQAFASGLVAILREKFAAGTVSRFREKLRKVDLLILDEMGYMPFSQTGANRMIHFLCKN